MRWLTHFRCLLGLALCVWAFAAAVVAAEPANAPSRQPGNDNPKHPANRLSGETSTYLQLHAHNPVDWYPWGPEALEKARKEKKLIFLSIGYASCYWCHVMERESFMDEQIAKLLNQNFVCIKVDREERPDIDEIYMQALHVYLRMVGSQQGGGWPLSMFLTPDAKPLMGGTYFPPRDRDGRLGFLTVLERVQSAWTAEPEKWQKTGDSLAEYVADSLKQRPIVKVAKLDRVLIDSPLLALTTEFDFDYGGFGFDPANPKQAKFPEPPNLFYLLDYAQRYKSETASKMLSVTLAKIAEGGIRDHVGGGFHRYSTDRFWRVPHFEKMLYDNAQLAAVYAQAYAMWQRPADRRVVEETVAFMLRELATPQGVFQAALDAETDGEEGRYYVWDRAEVEKLLTPAEYQTWSTLYGLTGEANFEGHYIPLLQRPLADSAAEQKLSEQELAARIQPIHAKLLAARSQRARPLVDANIIAGWNGLAIRGLADAGRVLQRADFTGAAVKAADFVLANMRDADGRLYRTYADGKPKQLAYLDDYAYLIQGLLALAQATDDPRWTQAAEGLMAKQLELFSDEQGGGFFYTSTAHESLIARSKLPTDGVTPSANSVSALNLIRLAGQLPKPEYLTRARGCIDAGSPILQDHPAAAVQLAQVVAEWLQAMHKESD